MSQQNVQAMRKLYLAFNQGDLDVVDEGYSSNIVFNAAENAFYAGGSPYKGFPAIRDGVFNAVTTEFEDFRSEVEDMIDAGDTIVATGRYRGRSRQTGKDLSGQFCHIMHVDGDGKVDRFQEYCDTLHGADVAGRAQRTEEARAGEPLPA